LPYSEPHIFCKTYIGIFSKKINKSRKNQLKDGYKIKQKTGITKKLSLFKYILNQLLDI